MTLGTVETETEHKTVCLDASCWKNRVHGNCILVIWPQGNSEKLDVLIFFSFFFVAPTRKAHERRYCGLVIWKHAWPRVVCSWWDYEILLEPHQIVQPLRCRSNHTVYFSSLVLWWMHKLETLRIETTGCMTWFFFPLLLFFLFWCAVCLQWNDNK